MKHSKWRLALVFLLLTASLLTAALCAWQVQRLQWKEALLQKVAERVNAPAVPLPAAPPNPSDLEYRHVLLQGRWLPVAPVWVVALTAQGSGYWQLLPLLQDDGAVVWVNRGFVSQGQQATISPPPTERLQIEGLVRLSEPAGTWLRRNAPEQDRWYSRDVPAMTLARSIAQPVQPVFVDQQTLPAGTGQGQPIAGLTVLQFPNNHLQYALTWLALSLMSLWGSWMVWRHRADPGDPDDPGDAE